MSRVSASKRDATAKEFIERQEWPMWPLLPLKKINAIDPVCGVIHTSNLTKVVLHFNVWHPPEGPRNLLARDRTWSTMTEGMATETFDSIEAMLLEWRID